MAEVEYAKSTRGLWVRARQDGDDVLLEAQERVTARGGIVAGIGADGEVRWEAAMQGAPPAGTWYEVGRVGFGDAWEALRVPVLDWPLLARGVQRHLVGLVAAGWGETVAEVAAWFVDPLAGATCVVPGLYRIERDYAVLRGFAGLLLRAEQVEAADEEAEDARQGGGVLLGLAMPRLEAPIAEWVLALLVAAVPIPE